MVATLKVQAGEERDVELCGVEVPLLRIMPILSILNAGGRIFVGRDAEPEVFYILVNLGLVEWQWFGRELGHGYVVADEGIFASFCQQMEGFCAPCCLAGSYPVL